MHKYLLLMLSVFVLMACDQEPPEETVWEEQLNTMDKARDVEQQVLDAAQQQRQSIEQQTQQ